MFSRIITTKTHRTDIRDPYIVMLCNREINLRMSLIQYRHSRTHPGINSGGNPVKRCPLKAVLYWTGSWSAPG